MGSEDFSSTIIVLGIALSALELIAGVALGWWVRGSRKATASTDVEKARDVLSRLHELTSSVAADVGEHSSRVQAINSELASTATAGASPLDPQVIGAMTQVIEANESLQKRLALAEERLNLQAEQIEVHVAVAMTDALTSIANRRAFDREITRRLSEWQRRQVPFSLIMADVDHFKKFNDQHGHQAGDEVLRNVAATLAKTMRTMDFVARYGGEEFALILPSTVLAEAGRGAERARSAIAAAMLEFGGEQLRVTISLGYAQAQTEEDGASLIRRADESLYAAKKAGRNRSFWHDGVAVGATLVSETAKAPGARPEVKDKEPDADHELAGGRTDVPTGLANRTAFCEEVRRGLLESQRYGAPLSLMLIKVDALSSAAGNGGAVVNPIFCEVSKILIGLVQQCDLVARYSSSSFGVLLPGTSLGAAVDAAHRLQSLMKRNPVKLNGTDPVTLSIGLAAPAAGDDSAALLKRAETAGSSAVKAAGDCIFVHDGAACTRWSPPAPSLAAPPPPCGAVTAPMELAAAT